MTPAMSARYPDWNAIAREVVANTDADYDGHVSPEELAEFLFLGFDINPSAEDREWVAFSLEKACRNNNIHFDPRGLDYAELTNCLRPHGKDMWEGAAAWAAEKANSTYNAAVWETIFANVDADSDGTATVDEAIASMTSYWNITLAVN